MIICSNTAANDNSQLPVVIVTQCAFWLALRTVSQNNWRGAVVLHRSRCSAGSRSGDFEDHNSWNPPLSPRASCFSSFIQGFTFYFIICLCFCMVVLFPLFSCCFCDMETRVLGESCNRGLIQIVCGFFFSVWMNLCSSAPSRWPARAPASWQPPWLTAVFVQSRVNVCWAPRRWGTPWVSCTPAACMISRDSLPST